LFDDLAPLAALNLAQKPDDVSAPDRFLEDQATTRELWATARAIAATIFCQPPRAVAGARKNGDIIMRNIEGRGANRPHPKSDASSLESGTMMADHGVTRDRPAFAGAIKASRVIGAVVAAGLVVTALACLQTARTHQAVTPQTEASESLPPATKVELGGGMTGYQLLL
jgi:hypothetical protein